MDGDTYYRTSGSGYSNRGAAPRSTVVARGRPPTGGWDPDRDAYGGGRHGYRRSDPDDYRHTGAPRRAPVLRYAGEQPGVDPPRPLWRRRGKRRRAMPLWQELPLLLIVAFCLAVLIRTFLSRRS